MVEVLKEFSSVATRSLSLPVSDTVSAAELALIVSGYSSHCQAIAGRFLFTDVAHDQGNAPNCADASREVACEE